jgi:hypothetical protein
MEVNALMKCGEMALATHYVPWKQAETSWFL